MSNYSKPLVIFDCDGVLVDSELISITMLMKHCEKNDFPITQREAFAAFLGRPLSDGERNIRTLFGRDIPPIDLDAFQANILEKFQSCLRPTPGVSDALKALGNPTCVASSSGLDRIKMSLALTNLGRHFGTNLFSTDMVQKGKPDPDVFLYAAKVMGVAPEEAIVVEDSPAGIQAAQAAGMRTVGFCGASHAKPAKLREGLQELNPDYLIDDMTKLPSIISNWSA